MLDMLQSRVIPYEAYAEVRITGTTLNVQSFMGAIMAIGIAVANSILLVTFAEHARRDGTPLFDAAREGVVLLRNEGPLLPLKKDVKSIAVIGPNADNADNLFGDYSPMVVPQHVATILDGIKAKVSPATHMLYAKGCNVDDQDKSGFQRAVQAAKGADVARSVIFLDVGRELVARRERGVQRRVLRIIG